MCQMHTSVLSPKSHHMMFQNIYHIKFSFFNKSFPRQTDQAQKRTFHVLPRYSSFVSTHELCRFPEIMSGRRQSGFVKETMPIVCS